VAPRSGNNDNKRLIPHARSLHPPPNYWERGVRAASGFFKQEDRFSVYNRLPGGTDPVCKFFSGKKCQKSDRVSTQNRVQPLRAAQSAGEENSGNRARGSGSAEFWKGAKGGHGFLYTPGGGVGAGATNTKHGFVTYTISKTTGGGRCLDREPCLVLVSEQFSNRRDELSGKKPRCVVSGPGELG